YLRVDEKSRFKQIANHTACLLSGFARDRDLAKERERDLAVVRNSSGRVEVFFPENLDLDQILRAKDHVGRARRNRDGVRSGDNRSELRLLRFAGESAHEKNERQDEVSHKNWYQRRASY